MKLIHLGHSTVLVETGRVRLLIDPGNYSSDWHYLSQVDAVLVTHAHPDHCDPDWAPRFARRNPQARWLVEPAVTAMAPLEQWEPLTPDQSDQIGDISVTAVGGRHAVIHQDIPRIGNVGLVLAEGAGGRFFHPGDALDTIPTGIDLVAVPAHAPWCAMKELIDFTRQVAAPSGFLIHDGLVNERGHNLAFSRLNEMTGTQMIDARDQRPLEL